MPKSDFIISCPTQQLIDQIIELVRNGDTGIVLHDIISGNGHPGDKEVHIGIDLLTWVAIWTDLTLEDALKFRITRTENENLVFNLELDEPACKKFCVDKILEVSRIRLREQDVSA